MVFIVRWSKDYEGGREEGGTGKEGGREGGRDGEGGTGEGREIEICRDKERGKHFYLLTRQ